MNPIDNQNYKTNESVGKMFLHSCLGKFIIFAAILVVLFIIAVLTKPTDQAHGWSNLCEGMQALHGTAFLSAHVS